MVWFAMQSPLPLAVTYAGGAMVLPIVAVALATALIGVVAYKTITATTKYRPALRVVEGRRNELTLNPA